MKNFFGNKWVKYVIFGASVVSIFLADSVIVLLPVFVVCTMYWSEIDLPRGSFRVTFSGYSDEELAEIKRMVEEDK